MYINHYIENDSMTKTAYFKNNSPRNNNPFSKSDFANGSSKKSQPVERGGQISSRTTYQMDS